MNTVTNLSSFFSLFPKRSNSNCKISRMNFKEISFYLMAISKYHKLNMTSSNIQHTLVYLCIHYVLLFTLTSSRFCQFLYGNNVYLRMPVHFYIILLKLSLQVYSKNKLVGWTEATTTVSVEPRQGLLMLVEFFDSDSSFEVFSGTIFSSIVNDERKRGVFRKLLCDGVFNIIGDEYNTFSESELYSNALLHLSTYSSILMNSDYVEFTGLFPSEHSPFLGIHRFRNSEFKDVFYTSQASFSAVSTDTAELLCVLLKIYAPVFTHLDDSVNTISYLPGDVGVSVESIPVLECWNKILSATLDLNGTAKERALGIRSINRTTISTKDAENIEELQFQDISGIYIPTSTKGVYNKVVFLYDRKIDFTLFRFPCVDIYTLS